MSQYLRIYENGAAEALAVVDWFTELWSWVTSRLKNAGGYESTNVYISFEHVQ